MDYPKSVPNVGLVDGKFVDENAATGVVGSLIPAPWGVAVTDELLAVISAAGLVPTEGSNDQVISALRLLIQQSAVAYAADTGSANTYLAAFAPVVTTLVDGMVLRIKAKTANTGASTFKPNGAAAKPIVGAAHVALQGGEIAANGDVWLQYNSSIGTGSWVLIESTGGGQQIAPATQSQHAAQLGQVSGVVGSSRNVFSLTSPAASTTISADEIVVETALGGLRYCLPAFNKTINLSTVGAGGMDTGLAPVSGFVGIYAIYNPATGASALLATDATSFALPSIYASGSMPAGYTASALVAIWPTGATRQFTSGLLIDRKLSFPEVNLLNTTAIPPNPTPVVSSLIPKNARTIGGNLGIGCTTAAGLQLTLAGSVVNTGKKVSAASVLAGETKYVPFADLAIGAAQTFYYTMQGAGSGTSTASISIGEFTF